MPALGRRGEGIVSTPPSSLRSRFPVRCTGRPRSPPGTAAGATGGARCVRSRPRRDGRTGSRARTSEPAAADRPPRCRGPRDTDVELRHRIGHEMCRQRLEADDRRSVLSRCGDVVVGRLPASAAAGYELEQIAVQLQDEVRRELHVGEIRVDGVQYVAVSGDLLFGPVRRLSAPGHEVADALRRCHDALDSVRGLSALNDGALAERLEHLR